jgi:thiol-disulfide isomerase/thioredoxin
MYKKIVVFSLFLIGCTLKAPTAFSEEALKDTLVNLDNQEVTFQTILKKHQGKKILLNVWASWCRDCIKAIPKLKALQVENPQISYVFISSDKNTKVWKKALDTYQLKGTHYFMKDGMNSAFGSFLNSNWIPRYLVINENGFVDLFKAKKITDERIVNAIKK